VHVPGLASGADQVERRLSSLPGVIEVSASPLTENLLVRFDPARVDHAALLATVGAPPARAAGRRGHADRPVPAAAPASNGWLQAERSVVVNASPATCLEVVCAFERYPEWQGFVTAVEVHERDRRGRAVVVETRGEIGSRQVSNVMRYRYPTPNQVGFVQERGDLAGVEGGWRFAAAPAARARAHYQVMVKPGLTLAMVLRGGLYEQVRDLLLDHTLGELAARVEGSPDPISAGGGRSHSCRRRWPAGDRPRG
jgi:hypothetical protein